MSKEISPGKSQAIAMKLGILALIVGFRGASWHAVVAVSAASVLLLLLANKNVFRIR